MGRTFDNYRDSAVKCPFYKGFRDLDLRCEGPERGVVLIERYKKKGSLDKKIARHCAGDWEKCPLAIMMQAIYKGE